MLANFTSRKFFLIGKRSDFAKTLFFLSLVWFNAKHRSSPFLEVLILEKLATTCNIICHIIIMLHSFENLVHQGKKEPRLATRITE